jgi:hypothetical protein
MRPNKPRTTGECDLFRARLDQIINMKHELVQLATRIDWNWIDREVAPLYSSSSQCLARIKIPNEGERRGKPRVNADDVAAGAT